MRNAFETVTLNKFNGVANDIRDTDPNGVGKVRTLVNFDSITFPHRLIPHKSSESGQDTTTRKIKNFLFYNGTLYGLGINPGVINWRIFSKPNYSDGTWTLATNGTGAGAMTTPDYGTFVQYHGLLYGGYEAGSSSYWSYDIAGTTFTDTAHSTGINYSSLAQGLVHSKDDVLYLPRDNVITSYNVTNGWVNAALTLPTRYQITSLCEYGNYLAIACRDTGSSLASSKVFLWDRDSSVNTLAESVDWGSGDLNVIEELEGEIIGFSRVNDVDDLTSLMPRIQIKHYTSSGALILDELVGQIPGGNATNVYRFKQKINNRIFFAAALYIDSAYRIGIWSYGRETSTRELSLSLEYLVNNDTAITSIDGFYLAGSYMFVAYDGAGAISKTDDTSAYTATSIIETLLNPGMKEQHRTANKQLVAISVSTAPLPSSGSVVLQYAVDGGSFTTIVTNTTTGSVTTEMVKTASGTAFTSGREYQFRIASTGNAQPTELKYKYEVLETLL